MNPEKYLRLAASVSRLKDDDRTYYHGAVGIRKDGVIVAASNGNPKFPEPKHHAEARVLRKMGFGGKLFVVRTLADGSWAYSKPCHHCIKKILHMGVTECWFSSGNDYQKLSNYLEGLYKHRFAMVPGTPDYNDLQVLVGKAW